MLNNIANEAKIAITELIEISGIKSGNILVIGCSSSEIMGGDIGKASSMDAAKAVFDGIYPILKEEGIFLAAQCCEHLNRAIIIEQSVAEKYNLEIVNVIPQTKAGGSFATVVWQNMEHPVAVEHIKASAGLDIGNTLIGMHLKEVAVPVRLSINKIGKAPIVCARTRPKFIGGERAHYCEDLK
ncbi:MAG: TIGR01440 family protein [Ruminococcaceae bacterium]|nr:TIGR01440 family protein [Oscillospiraceae bacterium]